MVSVMLYHCIFCVALLMNLFVLCVACLTVFVNCLVKQLAICWGEITHLSTQDFAVSLNFERCKVVQGGCISACAWYFLSRDCIHMLCFHRSIALFSAAP